MPASIFGNPAAVVQLNQALFGIAPGNGKYTNQLDQANAVGAIPFARQLGQTVAATNEALAATVLANVGIVNATLQTALVQAFAAFPNDRGVVVLNLTNILTTLEGNAVYGAAAAQFNAQVATDFQYSTNSVNTQDSPVNAGTTTLTANTDVLSGNVFEAGLVFTPGGDNRVNSLQDEDRLTGTGANATLNATLGNANDNGGVVVTPTLNNIATINAAFTGAAGGLQQNGPVNTLDLQDATGLTVINTTRLSSGLGVTGATFANLGSAATNNFGISGVAVKSTVNYDFQEGVLADAGQAATFRLNAVQLVALNAHNNAGGGNTPGIVTNEGFENVTINSTGNNQIDALTIAQMRNLTLEGAGALGINNFAANVINGGVTTLGTTTQVGAAEFFAFTPNAIFNVNAPLERITGTTATGALTIDISRYEGVQTDPANSGRPVFLNFQGGTAADEIIHGNNIGDVSVVINGGGGNDTLSSYASVLDTNPLNATNPDITSIESLEVRSQANTTINIDLSEIGGLTNTLLRNETAAAAPVVFGLLEATQDQANNISINHGATRGNGINVAGVDGTTVRLNLNDASGANDTATIRLVTDQNNNVRFNFAFDVDGNQVADQFAAVGGAASFGNNTNRAGQPVLDANNQPINARVENITINDTDAESNAIELTRAQATVGENADNHRGTITITGGQAGQFMQLDATANAYRWDQSGASLDGGTASPTVTAINGRATNGSRSDVGNALAERLVAAVIDSSTYAGDVVVRVSDNLAAGSLGGQRITFGAGNDTVIFDQVNPTALNRNTAGLTISDTVAGGAGTDILGIDGHGFAVTITASEWTNVSGFEVIRTIGNGAASNNARGATNAYNLTLTNDLLNTNGAVDGGVKRIIIVNDNDATNDRADTGNDTGNQGQGANGNIAVNTGVETGITINAITLNANNSFEYRGEEGNSNTNDRFIMADANINGAAIIDGGAASNVTTVAQVRDVDSARNNDVLEVRNSATVSAGDLANISNVGTIELTNDSAAVQNSIVVLDDAIVDRMVDAYQTSRVDNLALTTQIFQNQERLVIKAIDNLLVNGATTGLTLQADTLTGRSAVDAFLSRGAHNIVTGGGNDRVVLLGNYNAGVYAANELGEAINAYANNTAGARVFAGTISLGGNTLVGANAGVDTLVTYGAINLAGATVTGVEGLVANSDVTLNGTTAAFMTAAAGTGIQFTNIGGTTHTLTITGAGTVDLAKVTVAGGGTLELVLAGGAVSTGVAAAGVTAITVQTAGTEGNDTFTGTGAAESYAGLGGNDTISGAGGADTLYGNAGVDSISGGNGQDSIIGGSGNDILDGGAGADTFVFSSAATNGVDTINNYEVATDILDLVGVAGVLQGAGVANAAANHVLGTNDVVRFATNVAAGQLADLSVVAATLNAANVASHTNDGIAGNSRTFILIDDGASTGVYFFSDSAVANTSVQVGELTHLATLVGIADATTVQNFAPGL